MTVIFSNERFMNDSSYRVSRRAFYADASLVEGGKKACVSFLSSSQKFATVHEEKERDGEGVPPPDLPDYPAGPHCTVLRSPREGRRGRSGQVLKGTCDKCLYSFARTLATYHDRDESRIRTPWKAFFRLSLLENSITCHYRGKCQ